MLAISNGFSGRLNGQNFFRKGESRVRAALHGYPMLSCLWIEDAILGQDELGGLSGSFRIRGPPCLVAT